MRTQLYDTIQFSRLITLIRRTRSLVPALTMLVAFVLMVTTASATPTFVTQVFEGEVTLVNPDGPFSDKTGSRFSYTVSYSLATPGVQTVVDPVVVEVSGDEFTIPGSTSTRFRAERVRPLSVDSLTFETSPTTFELAVDGVVVSSFGNPFDPTPQTLPISSLENGFTLDILIRNDNPGGREFLGVTNFPNGRGEIEDSLQIGLITLVDTSGTAFDDESLPIFLNLLDFDATGFVLLRQDGPIVLTDLAGVVDSITTTVVPVPEPGTAMLVGLSLAGLGASRRRSQTQTE